MSGKGGTGKTTLATNLAYLMEMGYVDLDVEEPNGHIFLNPEVEVREPVTIPTPRIDQERCTGCGICTKTCQFNALINTGKSIRVFEDLCHGCGACGLACPEQAISEYGREIGTMGIGRYERGTFHNGLLNLQEPMAGPIISRIVKTLDAAEDYLLDCAPGTSCNVVKALDGAAYALLVTEPSQYGLHDLKLAVALVRDLKIPHGIVINRSNEYDALISDYAAAEGIDLIGTIPFSKEAARRYSKGRLLLEDPIIKAEIGRIGQFIVEYLGEAIHAARDHQR